MALTKARHKRSVNITRELKGIFDLQEQAAQESSDYIRIVEAGTDILRYGVSKSSSPDPRMRMAKVSGFNCIGLVDEHIETLWHYILGYMPKREQSWEWITSQLISERPGCSIMVGGSSSRSEKTQTEFERGERYYQTNEEDLKRQFPGEFIAIWMNRVISHGTSFGQVAEKAYSQVGYHDMYIPKVGEPEAEIRITTRRSVP